MVVTGKEKLMDPDLPEGPYNCSLTRGFEGRLGLFIYGIAISATCTVELRVRQL